MVIYCPTAFMSDIASDMLMKQAEGVPRGLLRFIVLKFLSERPMSGAEIVNKVENETGGKWKPSPGSIYPLLAGLRESGFIHESSAFESGMKHYSLTDGGKEFFQEQLMFGRKFMEKMEYLVPMLIGGFYFGKNEEILLSAKESAKRFLQTFIELDTRKETLTKEKIAKIVKILDDSNVALRKIIEQIDGENRASISK
jgi:DNA-binding PadR family transcriptional regulator